MGKTPKQPKQRYQPPDDSDAELARERERRRRAEDQGYGSTVLSARGPSGGLGAQTGATMLGGR